MRKNPLCRAFRVDKVTLAGLEATLRHYLDPEEALREIPALRMLALPLDELEDRANHLAAGMGTGGLQLQVARGTGVVGGGTCPGVDLPTWTVRIQLSGLSPRTVLETLRRQAPPVVARVESDEVVLDLRTVDPGDDDGSGSPQGGPFRNMSRPGPTEAQHGDG